MNIRILLITLLSVLLIGGCAFNNSIRDYRAEKIQMQYPDWDDGTIQSSPVIGKDGTPVVSHICAEIPRKTEILGRFKIFG